MNTAIIARDYHCNITVPVSASEAYANICRVADWWTRDFEGSAQQPGDVFTVRFGETFVTFQITEAVSDKKIVWQVTDCYLPWLKDKKEWNNTTVVWEIIPNNNTSQVSMVHIGLTPEVECYEGCEKGWNHCVKDSLFQLVTQGVGLPQAVK